jgi:hypothetical protein
MNELHVLLDTNTIWTDSAAELVSARVREQVSSTPQDVQIHWYIPEIVRLERHAQMERRAMTLLPRVAEIERLVEGVRLELTQELLHERVGQRIQKELAQLGLAVIDLDYSDVNWKSLVDRAAYRQAPFDPSPDKEKGFKDALVMETFKQLCNMRNPSRHSRCVIISDDVRLREAIESHFKTEKFIYVYPDLEELRNLIGTITSEISEDMAAFYRDKASTIFRNRWKDVHALISDSFGDNLSELPPTATRIANASWSLHPPSLVAKSGSKLSWSSRVERTAEAYRDSRGLASLGISHTRDLVTMRPTTYLSVGDIMSPRSDPQQGISSWAIPASPITDRPLSIAPTEYFGVSGAPSVIGASTEPVLVARGRWVFEVRWSAMLSQAGNLTRTKLEAANHIETTWEAP